MQMNYETQTPQHSQEDIKPEPLEQEANHVLEEARMVLPGIQALFGFQLIAIFNARFDTALASYEQLLHLLAIILVALAIALIMTPAAYHRQAERGGVSRYFIDLSSNLLTGALALLLPALVLELYLIARIVLDSIPAGCAIAAAMFAVFAGLWFVFPRVKSARARSAR